jgi:dienelactone hydrolase
MPTTTAAPSEKFKSGGGEYNITIDPGPADGKRYPAIILLHGNGAFRAPFGDQIRGFAQELAKLNYVTAVPGYYADDVPPQQLDQDPAPHVATLRDAVAHVVKRKDVDPARVAVVGYSLGAAVTMAYIASGPVVKVNAFADFFGPADLVPGLAAAAAKFPPTVIFHNEEDGLVPIGNSERFDALLTAHGVEHVYAPHKPVKGEPATILNHPFAPGSDLDKKTRKQTADWFTGHMPATGA